MFCNVTDYHSQEANHVNSVACIILLVRVICFPCLSEYRDQPIPALHIPCTNWNITFISMICHDFAVVLAYFFTIPAELMMCGCAGLAGLKHGRVYKNVVLYYILVIPTVMSQSVLSSISPIFQWSFAFTRFRKSQKKERKMKGSIEESVYLTMVFSNKMMKGLLFVLSVSVRLSVYVARAYLIM